MIKSTKGGAGWGPLRGKPLGAVPPVPLAPKKECRGLDPLVMLALALARDALPSPCRPMGD